jgi:hypothetical protein
MGQPMRFRERVRLVVQAPDHPRPQIRLLRDGRVVARKDGQRMEWSSSVPWTYRAEVYARVRKDSSLGTLRDLRRGRVGDVIRARAGELQPWIFSNPIHVRKEQ